MAKIQTINQLISVFKDIATRHYQINGFGIGDAWEVGADEAKMHPVLWINPVTANMPSGENGYKTFEIDFEVRVFDLVNKDESNENDVLSDTIDILKDIIVEFKGHPYYVASQLNIINDISFESFTEEFDEEVSGWVCEMSMMTPVLTSFCGIPAADITGFEFPGSDCPDVNVLCPVFIDEIVGTYPIIVDSFGTTRTISVDTDAFPNTFLTGTTFNTLGDNTLTSTLNDATIINTVIDNFTDLTVIGDMNATTYYGDGSNLTGIISVDTNIANADLIFDGNHTALLTGNTWTIHGDSLINGGKQVYDADGNSMSIANYHDTGYMESALGQDKDGNIGGYLYAFSHLDVSSDCRIQAGGGFSTNMQFYTPGSIVHTQIGRLKTHFFCNGAGFLSANKFIVGSDAVLACEDISLQGPTLISDEFVHYASTTPTADACLIDNSISFHMDGTSLAGQYKDNVGLVTPITIGGIDTSRFIVRSAGTNTAYADFYAAYNACIAGDVLDVYTDEVTVCPAAIWNWTVSVTVNMNGHSIELINLSKIDVADGINPTIIGGGLFDVQSASVAFNFKGDSIFTSDKTTKIHTSTGYGGFGFTGVLGKEVEINGVWNEGQSSFCVRGITNVKVIINDCKFRNIASSNGGCIDGYNITVNDSVMYGYVTAGGVGSSNITSTTPVFNNTTLIGDGLVPILSYAVILNNCSASSVDTYICSSANEKRFVNCSFTHTGTLQYAFYVTGAMTFMNCSIVADTSGLLTNRAVVFINTTIEAKNGFGITRTSSAGDGPLTIKNCVIESTGNDTIILSDSGQGYVYDISDSTLISNTTSQYCMKLNTGSTARFDNLKMKNTATATDIYSRTTIPTDNNLLQINTSDAYGNIILG